MSSEPRWRRVRAERVQTEDFSLIVLGGKGGPEDQR